MRESGEPSNPLPRVIEGGREALEWELFWAIALGADRPRFEALNRMLTPAANASLLEPVPEMQRSSVEDGAS